jgi:hypothetical protein
VHVIAGPAEGDRGTPHKCAVYFFSIANDLSREDVAKGEIGEKRTRCMNGTVCRKPEITHYHGDKGHVLGANELDKLQDGGRDITYWLTG